MINHSIVDYLESTIQEKVAKAATITHFRQPLIGFASVGDPRFTQLQEMIHPSHKLPEDLLPSARSVVSFFLPFDERVVIANAQENEKIAEEWVVAYIETNALIERITGKRKRSVGRAAFVAESCGEIWYTIRHSIRSR